MKATLVEWLLLAGLIVAAIIAMTMTSQDASLLVAAFGVLSYAYVSKHSILPINRNVVLLMGVLTFLIVLVYRLMFSAIEVQLYIDDDFGSRSHVVASGAQLVQLLMIGALIGSLYYRGKNSTNAPIQVKYPNFEYLLVVAWAPLLCNLMLYLFYFRYQAYTDIHVMGRGPVGIFLKTIYFTYAAMILIASNSRLGDRAFKAFKWLLLGFFVVYGLLFNLRSPLLLAILLFIYFFGNRFSPRSLILYMSAAVLMFAAIGVFRDQSGFQDGLIMNLVVQLFGLGEFADTLRFAISDVALNGSKWGAGIAGTFLGFAEPPAHTYARMIAPDYFDQGGGFGFFILADLVINFGMLGALIVIFLVGFALTGKSFRAAASVNYSVFLPALYANSFALIRNDFGATFRGVVYIMIAVLVVKHSWILIHRALTHYRPQTAAHHAQGPS